MVIDCNEKYPASLCEKRAWIRVYGGFRDKVRYDLIARPHYAFGLLAAADMACFCGINRITAIEFGVAEGDGLLNLCSVAAQVREETGVEFDLIGFDTGKGLPPLEDVRDHPEIWSAGDFDGVDRNALEAILPANARIVWGDIRHTLADAVNTITAPIGFIANDLDLYSSTLASLALLDAPVGVLLPVTIAYFDDTVGSPSRIGSLFRNRWCGQLAAIDDFNATHTTRKIDRLYTLKARRPLDRELWLDQMYAVHALDHALRQPGAMRTAMTMKTHGSHDIMMWPI